MEKETLRNKPTKWKFMDQRASQSNVCLSYTRDKLRLFHMEDTLLYAYPVYGIIPYHFRLLCAYPQLKKKNKFRIISIFHSPVFIYLTKCVLTNLLPFLLPYHFYRFYALVSMTYTSHNKNYE